MVVVVFVDVVVVAGVSEVELSTTMEPFESSSTGSKLLLLFFWPQTTWTRNTGERIFSRDSWIQTLGRYKIIPHFSQCESCECLNFHVPRPWKGQNHCPSTCLNPLCLTSLSFHLTSWKVPSNVLTSALDLTRFRYQSTFIGLIRVYHPGTYKFFTTIFIHDKDVMFLQAMILDEFSCKGVTELLRNYRNETLTFNRPG